MANKSFYLEALLTFSAPATGKDVHHKAVQMFGSKIKGDKQSCRQSLERFVLQQLATKDERGLYLATSKAYDPISELGTKVRVLEAECERLRQRIKELEATA
jgi:hypothetical protein